LNYVSYCNSILQALYFCKPFRECVVSFPNGPNGLLEPSMLATISQIQILTPSLTNAFTSKKGVDSEHKSKIFLFDEFGFKVFFALLTIILFSEWRYIFVQRRYFIQRVERFILENK